MNKPKFKGRKGKTENGFRSMYEEKFAEILNENKIDFEYEKEKINYEMHLFRKYTTDFKVGDYYFETKGRFTASDRQKHKAIKICNPDLKIVLVFQQENNKLNKKSNTRYCDWCDKNGILWTTFKKIKEDYPDLFEKEK